nr:40S ribosomal protein S13 [Tanacetum cinerariifolium]
MAWPVTSKIIPWELHLMIQEALKLRELVKLHKINREAGDKNDSESELDNDHECELEECEDNVRSLVKIFKKLKQLPRDWKYDPATASTFVYAKADISALQKLPPPTHKTVRCCSHVYDPNQKFPKATNVPLNDDERLIWSEFLDDDKDYVLKRPLEIKNPIVSQIGNFAVAAFNEAVEMYVKEGEANNIHDIEIMKCKYIKMKSAYYFYITIEAIEERKHGVYEAKVDFMRKTSSKTLSHFVLTDCKLHKPPAKEGMMKRKTHPDSWLDCVNIRYTRMRRRLNRSICRGYDYQTPWGTSLP